MKSRIAIRTVDGRTEFGEYLERPEDFMETFKNDIFSNFNRITYIRINMWGREVFFIPQNIVAIWFEDEPT